MNDAAEMLYCLECVRKTPHDGNECRFCGFVSVKRPSCKTTRVKEADLPIRRHVEITHEPAAPAVSPERATALFAQLKEAIR